MAVLQAEPNTEHARRENETTSLYRPPHCSCEWRVCVKYLLHRGSRGFNATPDHHRLSSRWEEEGFPAHRHGILRSCAVQRESAASSDDPTKRGAEAGLTSGQK